MQTHDPQTEPSSSARPYAALVVVQATFGSLPVIGKVVLAVIPAISLVGLRIGMTALVLLAIQTYRGRIWLKERSDYRRLAVLSLFGVVFNQLLFIGGLSLTKASNTSLLAVTIPIFTLLISIIIGTEPLRASKIIGIVLAAAGVIFLIDPRAASFSSETTIGDIMIVVNSLSYGIYVATSKEVITRNGPFRSMMWVFLFASFVCVPLGILSFPADTADNVDSTTWMLIVYVALVGTAVPYFLNAWALARVNPTTVAVFIYMQPLIGFAMAVIFLDEALDFRFIIAALLVFAGVFLTTRSARSPELHITAA